MSALVLPFRRYADFLGRSRRREYWLFFVTNIGVSILIFAAGSALTIATATVGRNGFPLHDERILIGTVALIFLWSAIALIPGIAVSLRRLHDQDRSGWFAFIPIVGPIMIMFVPGTPGANRFGPDPKATI